MFQQTFPQSCGKVGKIQRFVWKNQIYESRKWLKTVISVDNSVEIVDNFFAVEK